MKPIPVPLQPEAWKMLSRAVATDTVPPALLFTGPAGVGKVETAMALARALNCEAPSLDRPCNECRSCRRMLGGNHPNMRMIYPVPSPAAGRTEERQMEDLEEALAEVLASRREAKLFAYEADRLWPGRKASLQIQLIRGLKRELSYSLGEGAARVVVLAEAHLMTPEAANALLKILEEPGPKTHWVLTSSRPGRLLPTIRSRCMNVDFEPVAAPELGKFLAERLGVAESLARTASAMAEGSPAAAIRILESGNEILVERDQALDLWRIAQAGQWGQVQRAVEGLRFRCYRDRGLVTRILRIWLLWVRDLLIVKAGLPDTQLANPDRAEGLKKAVGKVEWETLSARYQVLEDCIAAEGQNVAPEVLLYSALTRLTEASSPAPVRPLR